MHIYRIRVCAYAFAWYHEFKSVLLPHSYIYRNGEYNKKEIPGYNVHCITHF